ncbi:MAG: type II 3-dehydroquinate dehydratase [Ruminococcus sp.]|nr:type II 3-dehydroquinate dehydratase [Candidatus Apopatosoma intestinale]
MKIWVLNGPNLNKIGTREPDLYGWLSYEDLEGFLRETAIRLGIDVEIFQTNHEGTLVDQIQAAQGKADGLVINAGAYTHTSIAIADAIRSVTVPAVEVHLTNIRKRERFRRRSFLKSVCVKTIMGKGFDGYAEAMEYLVQKKK